jgi:hypothetical protein
MFPGESNTNLISAERDFYTKHIVNYERVPLLYGDSLATDINNVVYIQKQNQWIYFRQNNPFTNKPLYNTDNVMNGIQSRYYISKNNGQLLYGNNEDSLRNDPMALLETFVKYTRENQTNLNNSVSYTIKPTNTPNTSSTTTKVPNEFIIETVLTNALEKLKEELYKYNNESNVLSKINNNNGFLLCYENINFNKTVNGSTDIKPYYVDQTISFSSFFESNTTNKLVDNKKYICNKEDLYGGFLIPKLNTDKDLICDVIGNNNYKTLDIGKTLSIPLLFEYYLSPSVQDTIEKTIAFDLKPSLLKEPIHYIISFSGNYNYSASNIDNNIDN